MTVVRDPNWMRQPVRLTKTGQLFIGDLEFPSPILADSIKVEPMTSRHRQDSEGGERIEGAIRSLRVNLVTLTFLVGDVSIETKPRADGTAAPDGYPSPDA